MVWSSTSGKNNISISFLLPVAFLLVLAGCAAKVENRITDQRLVTASASLREKQLWIPSFLVPEWQQPYNHIGTVRAALHGGRECIYIDPERPVIYRGQFTFSAASGKTYTNQVYRVHFPKIPFSLVPFHLGAGKNVGLLIIITLSPEGKPLLVTTANTCGCYLAVIPTCFLPESAYPPTWKKEKEKQYIYGELLPARLCMEEDTDSSLLITVRPAVHRIMDVRIMADKDLPRVTKVTADLSPLTALKVLPLADGKTTSMYYGTWPLRGHVKGAIKPWESLLLSLISLDLYVGMDKEYGDTKETGNPFYTSLKPWNRKRSDLDDFPTFLEFYGWKL